jgi:hypothetical protein
MIEINNETHKDKRFSDSDIVTLLLDLKDKVDIMQKSLATLRPDLANHLHDLMSNRSGEERARRRERCWGV